MEPLMGTVLDRAVGHWSYALMAAARSALELDWETSRALRVPVEALRNVRVGEPVRWSDLIGADQAVSDDLSGFVDRADEMRRERGLHALNLVIGSVTFAADRQPLPVFIARVELRATAKHVHDWVLEVVEPIRACALSTRLLKDYGVGFDDAPVDTVQSALDAVTELTLNASARGVDASLVAGIVNQSAEVLDVYRDITSFDRLDESTLVAAIAGGAESRATVRKDHGDVAPLPWVTPLPADSSQIEVLTAIHAGRSIVVEGPPGTGKSQTIANCLALEALAGRRILFVSEKAAAIDVDVRRLEAIGLGPQLLNLHRESFNGDLAHLSVSLDHQPDVDVPQTGGLNALFPHSTLHHQTWIDLHGDISVLIKAHRSALATASSTALHRLMNNPEFDRAVSILSDATAALDAAKLELAAGALEQLRGQARRLQGIVDALEMKTSEPVAHLLDIATGMCRIHALSDEVSDAVAVPSPNRGFRASDYAGTYRNPGVRAQVLRELSEAIEQVRGGGWQMPATMGELTAISGEAAWAPLREVSAADWKWLGSINLEGTPLARSSAEHAAPAFLALAEVAGLIDRIEPSLLVELVECGLDRWELPHDSPTALTSALLTWRAADTTGLATAAELDREAGAAAVLLDRWRRDLLDVLPSAVQQAARRRATEQDHSKEDIELEGLVRQARRQRVTPRRLMMTAPHAVLARTPIVLASPWSVARNMPQDAQLFDLVVIDEASQIETSSAIPALARASQVVVFGDSLQLPPNRFFQGEVETNEDSVLGQDSLLDSIATLLAGTDRTRWLRWHYRSLDDRLVEFVNHCPELYAGRLLACSCPPGADSPISLVRYTGHPAEAVANALADLTDETAAVVTFGVELADDISARLGLVASDGDQPTVVRNVERFQGDERDVIVLVLPRATDARHVLIALGPIGQAGGERRLNVALTRARRRMVVLTNFEARDLASAGSVGAHVLARFMQSIEHDNETDSPVADTSDDAIAYVVERLQASGIDAQSLPQRSSASARIHAVVDGQHMCVDVETMSTSRLSAFDRELIRIEELERRGWAVTRTTVHEWLTNEASMLRRVLGAAAEQTT
jgi:hypothetical protein